MIFENNNSIGTDTVESAKRYRTILDPVVHYVFARPEEPDLLLSFVNAVFADKS